MYMFVCVQVYVWYACVYVYARVYGCVFVCVCVYEWACVRVRVRTYEFDVRGCYSLVR